MRVQVVKRVEALLTVAETVSMFIFAFSREIVIPLIILFMVRKDESSRRSDTSWAAIASSSVSGGDAGSGLPCLSSWSPCFLGAVRFLEGLLGEANRSSVSSASVSERERESRLGSIPSCAMAGVSPSEEPAVLT